MKPKKKKDSNATKNTVKKDSSKKSHKAKEQYKATDKGKSTNKTRQPFPMMYFLALFALGNIFLLVKITSKKDCLFSQRFFVSTHSIDKSW